MTARLLGDFDPILTGASKSAMIELFRVDNARIASKRIDCVAMNLLNG